MSMEVAQETRRIVLKEDQRFLAKHAHDLSMALSMVHTKGR